MYKATVNNRIFEIDQQGTSFLVNGEPFVWDLQNVSDGYFHVLSGGKGYRAEIIKTDIAAKNVSIKINRQVYSVSLKDKFDLLLEKMGMNQSASSKLNFIKAPMPGLIIDLKIKAGDLVKAGDPLLILEAMKMENILKSPGEGIIKSIKIKKGDSVEKGQTLIEF